MALEICKIKTLKTCKMIAKKKLFGDVPSAGANNTK